MKKLEFEKKNANNGIIELFGLPKSGKSTFLNKLAEEGKNFLDFDKMPSFRKFLLFLSYLFRHPLNTKYLFYKMNSNWLCLKELNLKDYFEIFRMRNSYLMAVLAKYELLKNVKKEVYVDEFIMQSLFMIKQKESSEEELRNIIDKLPKSRKIMILEETKKKRYERWKKIKKPARNLNLDFRMKWWSINEKNYEIIKKIMEKN